MTTTRELRAYGAGDVRLEQAELQPLEAGEALIDITHAGICGSDLHYYKEGRVGTFQIREPLTLGHEAVGIVREAPGSPFAAGDRVAIHPGFPCGTCAQCTAGRPNTCLFARYLGSAASWPHTQGAMRDLFAIGADHLRALPPELPLERAVLAEPLGVALHALAQAGDVAGRRVLVSGSGPIGLLAVRAAQALGAEEVWASDVRPEPLALARSLGAGETFDVTEKALPAEDCDVVIEASGAPAGLSAAIGATRRGGTLVMVGMVPADVAGYRLAEAVSHEVCLRGAFRFDNEIDDAVQLLARDEGFSRIVTAIHPVARFEKAFVEAANPAASAKVVLTFDCS